MMITDITGIAIGVGIWLGLRAAGELIGLGLVSIAHAIKYGPRPPPTDA